MNNAMRMLSGIGLVVQAGLLTGIVALAVGCVPTPIATDGFAVTLNDGQSPYVETSSAVISSLAGCGPGSKWFIAHIGPEQLMRATCPDKASCATDVPLSDPADPTNFTMAPVQSPLASGPNGDGLCIPTTATTATYPVTARGNDGQIGRVQTTGFGGGRLVPEQAIGKRLNG